MKLAMLGNSYSYALAPYARSKAGYFGEDVTGPVQPGTTDAADREAAILSEAAAKERTKDRVATVIDTIINRGADIGQAAVAGAIADSKTTGERNVLQKLMDGILGGKSIDESFENSSMERALTNMYHSTQRLTNGTSA